MPPSTDILRTVMDRHYDAYRHVLPDMGLLVHDMPTRREVDALLPAHTRAWLLDRAEAGHRDDLVLAPSVRHIGGWQRLCGLVTEVSWAYISDSAPLTPYRYPFEPSPPVSSLRERLTARLRGPARRAKEREEAEAARHRGRTRHDDGWAADWHVGFVLDDSPTRHHLERGLMYTRLHLAGQLAAITKENDQSHRPHGRTIGSITVVQYIAWQGMRRHLGLPLADVRRQEPFLNTEQMLTVHWRTRFPYYPAGTYQVPTEDPHTVGRTDHFGIVGESHEGRVFVQMVEHSHNSRISEGVRRVLRLPGPS